MSTLFQLEAIFFIICACLACLSLQNIHFFAIFASSPNDDLSPYDLSIYSKVSVRAFDPKRRLTTLYTFRTTFTTHNQELTPLSVSSLYNALEREDFRLNAYFQQCFVIIIGRGPAIQKALLTIRAWKSHQSQPPRLSVFVYDTHFFNHANPPSAIYQLNQDRSKLLYHWLNLTTNALLSPRSGQTVFIHDLVISSDQLYRYARNFYFHHILITDDQTEDVITSKFQNEIGPYIASNTFPVITFAIHVRNSLTLAKVFAAASRNNFINSRFVWLSTDLSVVVAPVPGDTASTYQLLPPLKPHTMPHHLLALKSDQKQLFNRAFTRLLQDLAKSLVRAARAERRRQNPYRKNLPAVSVAQMFQQNGSPFVYTDDARKLVSLMQVQSDRQGRLRVNTVKDLRNLIRVVPDKLSSVRNESSAKDNGALIDETVDGTIRQELKIYISLGQPFLFQEKNVTCSRPSFICVRIRPSTFTYEQLQSLPLSPSSYACCSGALPQLVRNLGEDLAKTIIVVIPVDSEEANNSTITLGLLNRKAVDMAFTMDPYIGHRSPDRYYVTAPIFAYKYAMLVAIRRKEQPLFSFLSPFPISVWIGIIFVLSPATALAISQFEWTSPFGLNPWGRKRSVNYTLGSGINMVYSLLFGHTIKTKYPKAWPSKWMQNVWAGTSIFMIASYTGNLARFLAKRNDSLEFENIYDLAATSLAKVGVIKDDPILAWLQLAESSLAVRAVVLKSLEDAIIGLKSHSLDVVIGEHAAIRYWQLTNDATMCMTKLLPRTFAHRDLAAAMLVDSPLRGTVSAKMSEYKTKGEFDQIISKNRLISLSLQSDGGTMCGGSNSNNPVGDEWAREASDAQLTLSHANGLFLTMIATIVCCCFILVAEHLTFYWLVPKLRLKKRVSFWRNFTLMYFSQRLYRIVNSEELLCPKEVLKDMAHGIKRMEFSRVFQKSARKKRFRKITIAEFVQQVKEEKEKSLSDVVVQTKGLDRARRAWKMPRSTSTESASTMAKKKDVATSAKSSFHQPATLPATALTPFLSDKDSNVDCLKSELGYSYSAIMQSTQANPRSSLQPKSESERASTSMLSPAEDPSMTAARRWQWLSMKMTSYNKDKAKRKATAAAYNNEMNKLHTTKLRLEDTVSTLLQELKEVRRQRDKLLIVEKLENVSAV